VQYIDRVCLEGANKPSIFWNVKCSVSFNLDSWRRLTLLSNESAAQELERRCVLACCNKLVHLVVTTGSPSSTLFTGRVGTLAGESFWVLLKLLLAAWRAEIVGLPTILTGEPL
jgi:hypothetical protein